MAQQNLNLGTTPNDGTGDTLRCAFCKTETNFTDVYSCISGIDTSISNINSCFTELDSRVDTYELFSWGYNSYGKLGTNNTICYSSPTQEICGGTNWCTVSSSSSNHSVAIKKDGTLWSWGYNYSGNLGTNNTTSYSSPQQEVCGGTNWCIVSGSSSHSVAIKTDGTLWSWGSNFQGKLGTNNTISYSIPTQEACGGTNWCMVSSNSHVSAIKKDGTLWSWGQNTVGQLGINTGGFGVCYSTPQQEYCGGTTWCALSAGCSHTSAIKTDGTLWIWGYNCAGQLGTNNTISYSIPTQEACGGNNWCTVSNGLYSSYAIKTNGTLWSWGYNFNGQLGTNNTTSYSTPQQEVCGGTNWCMLGGGRLHTSAIKTNGTLWSWGCGVYGVLGTNNTTDYSTPQQEACGGTNWCMVSGGGNHTSAIRID